MSLFITSTGNQNQSGKEIQPMILHVLGHYMHSSSKLSPENSNQVDVKTLTGPLQHLDFFYLLFESYLL